ncbi:hypothetical protein RYX36_033657 [Vicia faba]
MTQYREQLKNFLDFDLHKRIKYLLKGSGFDMLFQNIIKHNKNRGVKYCRPLMEALIQCFDHEDNTFNLGQTKIYFGLEDVLMITGLPIDGKPVTFSENFNDIECLELFGFPSDDGFISNKNLIEIIKNITDESTDVEVEQACRAVALLGISCIIMQEVGMAKIRNGYLSFLEDVKEIKSYAWGDASWVSMMYDIQAKNANIGGCTLALMIFAFLRMSELVQICYKKHKVRCTEKTFPLRRKWVKAISGPPSYDNCNRPTKDEVINFFNQQTEQTITWRPYSDVNVCTPYKSQIDIAKSITHVIGGNNHIPHRPDLVPKQLFNGDIDVNLIESWVNLINESIDFKSNWETRRDRLVLEASDAISLNDEGSVRVEINSQSEASTSELEASYQSPTLLQATNFEAGGSNYHQATISMPSAVASTGTNYTFDYISQGKELSNVNEENLSQIRPKKKPNKRKKIN